MSNKEHLLDIAEDLFNRFGYTAVGVDLIRDKTGISKTTMYRHFGSKSQLIEAVLIRRHQRFVEGLEAAIENTKNRDEKLDTLLNWHFQWFRQETFKGCMFMHALAEFKGIDKVIAELAVQHKVWLKSLCYCLIDPDHKEPDAKAEMLMALLEGMIIRAEFQEVIQYEEVYRTAAKALLQMEG